MYELIAGERRWRAAKDLGCESIPAVVRENVSDLRARMMGFVENSARLSCRPLEQARELESLLDAVNESGEPREGAELARGMGIGRTLRWQLLKIAKTITPDVVELVKRAFGPTAADAVMGLPKSRLLSAAKQKTSSEMVRILAKAPSEAQVEFVRAGALAAPSVHAVNTADPADDHNFFDISWSLTRSLVLRTTRPIADMPPDTAVRLLEQLAPAVEALRERARAA